jgi:hypothetical protein
LFLVGPELLRLPVDNAPLLTAGGDGGAPLASPDRNELVKVVAA